MKYQIDEASIVEIVEEHFRRNLVDCPDILNVSVWFDPEINEVWASVSTDSEPES